jgi:hypothetical protein
MSSRTGQWRATALGKGRQAHGSASRKTRNQRKLVRTRGGLLIHQNCANQLVWVPGTGQLVWVVHTYWAVSLRLLRRGWLASHALIPKCTAMPESPPTSTIRQYITGTARAGEVQQPKS